MKTSFVKFICYVKYTNIHRAMTNINNILNIQQIYVYIILQNMKMYRLQNIYGHKCTSHSTITM